MGDCWEQFDVRDDASVFQYIDMREARIRKPHERAAVPHIAQEEPVIYLFSSASLLVFEVVAMRVQEASVDRVDHSAKAHAIDFVKKHLEEDDWLLRSFHPTNYFRQFFLLNRYGKPFTAIFIF